MFSKKNLKQNFNTFLVKKIFSENYYQKYYIRKNILDCSNNFYNYKKNSQLGFSIYKNIYTYSHIYNNKFTFNSFLNKKNLKSKFFVKNFYNSLLNFKRKKCFFLLLKPSKGGFFAYFSGVFGFIPMNNILFLIEFFFLKVKTKFFFFLLSAFIHINKIIKYLRFSIEYIKIKSVLFSKRKNFSSAKKIKVQRVFFNSVFLLRKKTKPIKNLNLYDKIKKFKKKRQAILI